MFICYSEYHEWFLSDEIDLVARLVNPIAGPDTFTAEENESFPMDLQFLPDDKLRETDPEIRKLLLESLMQVNIKTAFLCISFILKTERSIIRDWCCCLQISRLLAFLFGLIDIIFFQLCQTKICREILRNQNIYLILREHHKSEKDKHCVMLNEDIANLLLRYFV